MPENTDEQQVTNQSVDDASLANISLSAIEAESSEDITPNTQPESSVAESPLPSAVLTAKNRKEPHNKKRIILFACIAVIILVLMGGGAAAYAWYTNPEKVVTDSVMNAAGAHAVVTAATMHFQSGDSQIDMAFHDHLSRANGLADTMTFAMTPGKNMPKITVTADTVYLLGSATYLRVSGLTNAYHNAVDALISQMQSDPITSMSSDDAAGVKALYDQTSLPIIKKIDGQWIKITADDLRAIDKDMGNAYACSDDAYRQLLNDKTLVPQVTKAYQKDKPLIITDAHKARGNDAAYNVSINKNTVDAFTNDLSSLPVVKAMNKCADDVNNSMSSSGVSSDSASSIDTSDLTNNTAVTLWVNKWNHTMSGFDVKSSGSLDRNNSYNVTVSGTASFNAPAAIDPPKDAKNLSEISKDLESAFQSFFGSADSSGALGGDASSLQV